MVLMTDIQTSIEFITLMSTYIKQYRNNYIDAYGINE